MERIECNVVIEIMHVLWFQFIVWHPGALKQPMCSERFLSITGRGFLVAGFADMRNWPVAAKHAEVGVPVAWEITPTTLF